MEGVVERFERKSAMTFGSKRTVGALNVVLLFDDRELLEIDVGIVRHHQLQVGPADDNSIFES